MSDLVEGFAVVCEKSKNTSSEINIDEEQR